MNRTQPTHPQLIVELWDGDRKEWEGPLEEVIEANEDWEEELRSLAPGRSVILGGGAQPVWEVRARELEHGTEPFDPDALALINAHRRRIGQPLLDPVAQGWTAQDVLDEAKRLRRKNGLRLRRSLLR